MNLFADTLAPVKRTSADDLFLVRMVAEPSTKNPEALEIGGAYVNCWVDADELRIAEERTIEAIEREQWQPTKFDHWQLVCRRCYVEDSRYGELERRECLEHLNDAFAHGISIEFKCWLKDAPDANGESDAEQKSQ